MMGEERIMMMIIYLKNIDNEIYMKHIEAFAKSHPSHYFTERQDKNADIILTESFSQGECDVFPRLKAVFAPIVGRNRFALDALEQKNIQTFFVDGAPEIVAEHAFALALTLMGKVAAHDRNMKAGDRWSFEDSYWDSIYGARVSILGAGRIGTALSRYLRPFNCTVTGFGRNTSRAEERGYDCLTNDLGSALDRADVVFVSLELSAETYHLIAEREIARMRGAYLINIARADIIDEAALAAGIENRILKGFAADPWYCYPKSYPEGGLGEKDHVRPSRYDFYKRDNVVCAPHTGTQTVRAREIYIDQLLAKLDAYLTQGE